MRKRDMKTQKNIVKAKETGEKKKGNQGRGRKDDRERYCVKFGKEEREKERN